MRKESYTGDCPKCGELVDIIKTNSYKRFAKCSNPDCNISYPLPKSGSIIRSGLYCPDRNFPILIIEPRGNKIGNSYFWADKPCFDCSKFNSKANQCENIKILIDEFTENEEFGFGKDTQKSRV